MKTYVQYHGEALDLAVKAKAETNADKKNEMFIHALFLNAFADHFLTDGFATGHLRNPRAQSLRWQEKNGYGKTAVDALAKLVHDHDHLLSETHGPGLAVVNTRGDKWHTRCDGELLVLAKDSDPQLAIPKEAVTRSVKEVLTAFKGGTLPVGVFSAAELVPFLQTEEQALVDIFKPDLPDTQIEAWLKSLGIINYFRIFIGLNQSMTRTYFAALPSIMDDYRKDVATDSQDATLQKRLPNAYIEGFKIIK